MMVTTRILLWEGPYQTCQTVSHSADLGNPFIVDPGSRASMRETSIQINKNYSQTNETIFTTVEWERGTENTPVFAVVSAVAEVKGSDPVELPPLYEAINPEALNDLFTSRPESAIKMITFQYAGYDIVVRGDGEVQIQFA